MEDETLWIVFGIFWLYKQLENPVTSAVKAIEKGGASLYEFTHPSERDHMNDLPEKQLSRPVLLDLATRAGFPDPQMAVAIALAESGGFPSQVTDTRGKQLPAGHRAELSVGLWQINLLAHPGYTMQQLLDPGQNALAAFAISHGGTDWRPWSVYKSGRYKLYLHREINRA